MIKFKTPDIKTEWDDPKVKPSLKFIVLDIANFITARGYEFVVTDILSEESEDKKLKRVSKSHQEGRAVDVRTRDWPKKLIDTVIEHFNNLYSNEAAISASTKKPTLIVYHNNGNGIHFHIQVRK